MCSFRDSLNTTFAKETVFANRHYPLGAGVSIVRRGGRKNGKLLEMCFSWKSAAVGGRRRPNGLKWGWFMSIQYLNVHIALKILLLNTNWTLVTCTILDKVVKIHLGISVNVLQTGPSYAWFLFTSKRIRTSEGHFYKGMWTVWPGNPNTFWSSNFINVINTPKSGKLTEIF